MIKFPMYFDSAAETESGISALWASSASGSSVKMAIPPEFDGPGGGFSPEDLYGMALCNCFVATFKVFAEKSQLNFEHLGVDAQLTIDRGEGGRPWMAKINLKIRLRGASDKAKAESLLKRTSESCMILNSVKTDKSFEFQLD